MNQDLEYQSSFDPIDKELDFIEGIQDFPSDHSYERPTSDFPESLVSKNETPAIFSEENNLMDNEGELNNLSNFEDFNKFSNNEKNLGKESLKIQKKRKKWENFSFHIPEHIKFLDIKSQRKEIQKIKNRISAQISRDKKKCEFETLQSTNLELEEKYHQLEEENLRLMHEMTMIQQENSMIHQENAILTQKLHDLKCKKCGFCNSESETISETNESSLGNAALNSPLRVPLSRTSSYSNIFLGTLMFVGALTIVCLASPFITNEPNMRNINMFAQINHINNTKNITHDQWKKIFFNSDKESLKEKTIKLRNQLVGELSTNEAFQNDSNSKMFSKKRNDKFLEKKQNYPIVPWNYFLDKITTVFCPYPYVYKNNTFENNNSTDSQNAIKINGEWLHLLIPQANNTPEAMYIQIDENFKGYKQYLEVWAKIYGMREFKEQF